MNEQTKNPITLVTDLLAAMTERAAEAECQRDAAKKDTDNWYRIYQEKEKQLKETEAKLAAEIEGHRKTRETVQTYIESMEGGSNNA